jgi:hypothetical protein
VPVQQSTSVAGTDTPPPDVTGATPLTSSNTPTPHIAQNTSSSGGVPQHPTQPTQPSAKPVPTPTPHTGSPDPPVCVQARAARARGSPVADALALQCTKAGGKL